MARDLADDLAPDFLSGGGAMGASIRARDWSTTALGPVEGWPSALRVVLGAVLANPFPTVLAWGPELTTLHNDAYRPLLGGKPDALGRPVLEVWDEVRDVLAPLLERALAGEALRFEKAAFTLERHGRPEQAFFDFSFSPVRDESGGVGGVLHVAVETTAHVLADRRQAFRIEFEERLRALADPDAVLTEAVALLGGHLGADRVGYSEIVEDRIVRTAGSYAVNGMAPLNGDFPIESFGEAMVARQRRGITEVCDDVLADPERKDDVWAAIDTRSVVSAPLVRDGRFRASIYVNNRTPRRWTREEVALIEEIGARTWDAVERARAEAALRVERRLLRAVIEQAPVGVSIAEAPSGRSLALNDKAVEITGHDKLGGDIERYASYGARHPNGRPYEAGEYPTVRALGGEAVEREEVAYNRGGRDGDGPLRRLEFSSVPVRDKAGAIVAAVTVITDVEGQRRAEEEARANGERQAFLFALGDRLRGLDDPYEAMAAATRALGEHLGVAQVGFGEIDEAQTHVVVHRDWNDGRLASVVGAWRMDDFGPRFIRDMKAGRTAVIPDVCRDPRTMAPPVAAAYQGIGTRALLDVPLVKGGRLAAMLFIHHPEPRDWRPEEVSLVEAVCERLWAAAERARAETALRESEARYRTLFEAIDAGFCIIEMIFDGDGRAADYRFIEVNPAFERQSGLVDAAGRRMRALAPDHEEHWFELYGRVALTGEPTRFEHGAAALDRWFDVHAFRVGAPEGRRVAVLFNDITQRRRVELALRELNETLEAQVAQRTAERDRVWRNSRDLLVVVGADGLFHAVNPAWRAILGHEPQEMVGRSYLEFVWPEDAELTRGGLEDAAAARDLTNFENRYRAKDGAARWISWHTSAEGDLVYAYGRDITAEKTRQAELEAAQEQLRQSQKMEAMGQLTGGVAHDFNNLLTPIVGGLDMLQRRGLGGERERRMIEGALQSAERAKTLVQRLLAFARRQPLQTNAVDVRALVEGMADLVASTSGPRIKVVIDLAGDLQQAKADANQLEMAILNLAVNARDAMEDGGVLTVSAANETVAAGRRPDLAPGRYVRLSVADTGSGMDEATLERAVEPFFSTKGIGRGTGLGLSMVHGLAAQLGGGLVIASKSGLGTKVELWLPAAEAAAEKPERTEEADRPAGTGTALLVDDEELVRASTADMLADMGYSVVEAASADEALKLLDDGLRPDLLVTDHLMPGMTGTELAREARSRRPDLPVLIVSGYADADGIAPDLPRISKPFRRSDLAAGVAELTGALLNDPRAG